MTFQALLIDFFEQGKHFYNAREVLLFACNASGPPLLAAGALSLRVSSAESESNGKGSHRIISDAMPARSEWHNDEDSLYRF